MKPVKAVNIADFLIDCAIPVYKYGKLIHRRIMSTPAITSSTVIKSMHFRSVGHCLLKHGLQSASLLITMFPSPIGPVFPGSVEPNIATTGILRAAAMCMGPESFVINTVHCFISAISSIMLVLPAILMTGTLERFSISVAISNSCLLPKMIIAALCLFTRALLTWAKRSGYQRFAEPYAAPGFMPIIREPGEILKFCSVSFAY